jgi:1-acyl-sn-glycerol-3-phosphate acyltransferase
VTSTTDPNASSALRAYRYVRIGLHLIEGALTVLLRFGTASDERRRHLRQRWSQRLLRILGVRMEVAGDALTPGSMLVSNHISWVDIFVINALRPAAFISKADVRGWPLIGWLAARNDTVFLRRGSRGHARIVNAEIARILDAGQHVAVFPEGTTTNGRQVLHFHGALLQPALVAGHPVQPVALAYTGQGGRRSLAPAYDGDVTLGQSIRSIVAQRETVARLWVLPSLVPDARHDRRTLAADARTGIAGRIESVAD